MRKNRDAWFVLGSGSPKVLAVHCNIVDEQIDDEGFEYLILDEPVTFKVPKDAARTMTGALKDLREYYDECPSSFIDGAKRNPYTLDKYRSERNLRKEILKDKEHGKEWFHILDVAV